MVKRLYLQIIKRIIIKKYNRKNGCNICTSHISIKQLQNINCGVLIGKKCVFADPAGSISIGDYTYMNSGYIYNAHIGKYCSIGNNVSIGPGEHHKLRISSFPISSIVFNDFRSDDFILNKPSVIGNDVWIGNNAVILQGVIIGDIGMQIVMRDENQNESIVTEEEIERLKSGGKPAWEYGVTVTIKDFGTGIDKESILNIAKVGNSRRKERFVIKEMPPWLTPTAEFGIGLQSAFIVTNLFKCRTYTRSNEKYEITFSTVKSNFYEGYINVQPLEKEEAFGTCFEVFVPISKKLRHQLYPSAWDGKDYFDEDYEVLRPVRHAAELLAQMALYLDRQIGEQLFPVHLKVKKVKCVDIPLNISEKNQLKRLQYDAQESLNDQNQVILKEMKESGVLGEGLEGVEFLAQRQWEKDGTSWIYYNGNQDNDILDIQTGRAIALIDCKNGYFYFWDNQLCTFCTINMEKFLYLEKNELENADKECMNVHRNISIYYKGIILEEIEVSDLEIAHALVGEAGHHRLLGQQHEVRGDVYGDGHRTSLAGVRAREGRFDDDVFGERLHGLDFRELLFRGAADAERSEDVVEALFTAVEDLVDLDDDRRGVGVVGFDRELFDGRFAVVVLHRTGDAVALGRGDARVVGHDPDFFIEGVLAETDDLFAVAHALVDAAVVQGVGYARYFVDDQDVAAHQRVGDLEQEIRAFAVDIEQTLVGHGAFQQFVVAFLLVFFERVGLRGGGFGFLRFAARLLLGLRRSGRQQEECRQGSCHQGESSCVHLLLLGFFRILDPHDAIIKSKFFK